MKATVPPRGCQYEITCAELFHVSQVACVSFRSTGVDAKACRRIGERQSSNFQTHGINRKTHTLRARCNGELHNFRTKDRVSEIYARQILVLIAKAEEENMTRRSQRQRST